MGHDLRLRNGQVPASRSRGKTHSTSTEIKPGSKCWISSESKKKRGIVNQKITRDSGNLSSTRSTADWWDLRLSGAASYGVVLPCPQPVHGGDSVAQEQDFGRLNITPRHTILGKGYDSTRRRVATTTQRVRTASERVLQGVVRDVSVDPLSVNELAAGVEEVWVTSHQADGLSAYTTWTLTPAVAIPIARFAFSASNGFVRLLGRGLFKYAAHSTLYALFEVW